MPSVVIWRSVDRNAVHLNHAVVVSGDPKRQRKALVMRRGLDIHFTAYALESSGIVTSFVRDTATPDCCC